MAMKVLPWGGSPLLPATDIPEEIDSIDVISPMRFAGREGHGQREAWGTQTFHRLAAKLQTPYRFSTTDILDEIDIKSIVIACFIESRQLKTRAVQKWRDFVRRRRAHRAARAEAENAAKRAERAVRVEAENTVHRGLADSVTSRNRLPGRTCGQSPSTVSEEYESDEEEVGNGQPDDEDLLISSAKPAAPPAVSLENTPEGGLDHFAAIHIPSSRSAPESLHNTPTHARQVASTPPVQSGLRGVSASRRMSLPTQTSATPSPQPSGNIPRSRSGLKNHAFSRRESPAPPNKEDRAPWQVGGQNGPACRAERRHFKTQDSMRHILSHQ